MKKTKQEIKFVCRECGYESLKWLGKCPECNSWNSFVEYKIGSIVSGTKNITNFTSEVQKLDLVKNDSEINRILTHINEFDRIMGGGIVLGSVILLGGEPGIGKSTLMLQVAQSISNSQITGKNFYKVLYVSGEESVQQIKLRADRLNIKSENLYVVSETSIEKVISLVEEINPDVLILDSIQTLYSENIPNTQGSVAQVRGVTAEIIRIAKNSLKKVTVFILGHVTKDGDIAGPRLLEHMVDTVLYFESETTRNLRILRVYKNRFGATSEIGVFEMTSLGLKEVLNPSEIFIEYHENLVGTTTTCLIEGSRPILTQVQALVTRTYFPQPRRVVSGIDYNRANLLISVLEKFTGIVLTSEDIYINIVSGLKTKETALDLAVLVSIYSAHKNLLINNKNVYLGEIGLTGELRAISFVSERVSEAIKLGYKKIFLPRSNETRLNEKNLNIGKNGNENIEIKFVSSIKEIEKIV
jgi:DNA repair protein RadA/Sms